MTWTGTKNMIDIRMDTEALLSSRFQHLERNGELFFKNKDSVLFHLCVMGEKEPWNALVIEYMDTMEDGDLFYPEDYKSIEEMVAQMVKEIDTAEAIAEE